MKDQESWKNLVDYNRNINSIINTVCEPIKSMGINYFHYTIFYNNGKRIYICSEPKWLEHYLDCQFYNNLAHANVYSLAIGQHKALWSSYKKDDIFTAIKNFNIGNGFSIINRHPEMVESFHFASTIDNHSINQFYLNHSELFLKFMDFFKNRIKSLIPLNNQLITVTSDLKLTPISLGDKKVKQFFDIYKVKKYLLDEECVVTPRQFEILGYLATGVSPKEVARILNLSTRTIEEYINLIMLSSSSSKKSKIIELFLRNCLSNRRL